MPRYCHSAVYDELNKKIYIFGGQIEDGEFTNELWQLDILGKLEFKKLKNVSAISNRCKHACFINNNKLYFYGGFGIHRITKQKRNYDNF